jgi:hypothetical protein
LKKGTQGVSPQRVKKKRQTGKDVRSPVTSPFILRLNPVYLVHPCKFSCERRNVRPARREARLSSAKLVKLVGPTEFSDEVFCAWKNTGAFRRFAKHRRGTNSKIPNSSTATGNNSTSRPPAPSHITTFPFF